MRVLVTGGRRYSQAAKVFTTLQRLHERRGISCIIQGGASGADMLASMWGTAHMVDVDEYPIGPGESGFDRNGHMLIESRPDLVVHFPGGDGTADMVAKARAAGVRVVGGLDEEALREL